MAGTTEIIRDASAFLRSTVTTVVAFTLGLAGLTGALIALDIVPEDKKALLVGVNAALVVITSAGRQIIAWLDKNNPSFGRVAVEPEVIEEPAADEPAVEEPAVEEPVVEDLDPIDLPDVDDDEVVLVDDDAVDEPIDLRLD
jgi:hypothetical protein